MCNCPDAKVCQSCGSMIKVVEFQGCFICDHCLHVFGKRR